MYPHELLFNEIKDWEPLSNAVHKITYFLTPFLFSFLGIALYYSYNDVTFFDLHTDALISAAVAIVLGAIYSVLIFVHVMSLSEKQIREIYFKPKYDLMNRRLKIFHYVKMVMSSNGKLVLFPTIILMSLTLAQYFYYDTSQLNMSYLFASGMVMYFVEILPLKYTFTKYQRRFVGQLTDALSNTKISNDEIERLLDLKQIENSNKDDLKNILINARVNLEHIDLNIKKVHKIALYFKENMDPPSALEYIRFSLPIVLNIALGYFVPMLGMAVRMLRF